MSKSCIIKVEIEGCKFSPGTVLLSTGVKALMCGDIEFTKFVVGSVKRHVTKDWGEVDGPGRVANNLASDGDDRIISCYEEAGRPKVWIITERQHIVTVILFPGEFHDMQVTVSENEG